MLSCRLLEELLKPEYLPALVLQAELQPMFVIVQEAMEVTVGPAGLVEQLLQPASFLLSVGLLAVMRLLLACSMSKAWISTEARFVSLEFIIVPSLEAVAMAEAS